ncbi:MAG: TonB-dependent receptor [Bacteroidales bacterium]
MRIITLVIFVLIFNALNAQTKIKVLDKITSEPIPFAIIRFEGLHNQFKSAGSTNELGEFEKVLKDTVVITVSSVSYITTTDTLFPQKEHIVYLLPLDEKLNDVVVTATAVPISRDKSIYKIDMISNVQIKERASNNMADLLSTQSGVRVEQNGTLGSSVRMQGLSGEQVKILIDGVPVVGRVNGNINLNQLNLQNVDHVEIIEGPMSVIYGSDAMGGVINIITKENAKKTINGTAGFYYETIGKYNGNLAFTLYRNKHTLNFSGNRNFFDGAELEGDPERTSTWKPSLQYNFDASYIYTLPKSKIKLSSSYFYEEYRILGTPRKDGEPEQTDSTLVYHAIANDAYNFTTRFVNKLDYTYNWNKSALNIVGSYSNYKRSLVTYKTDLTLMQKTTEGVANQDTQKINSVMVRGMWSNHRFNKFEINAGPDFNYDHAIDESDFGSKYMTDMAAFFNLKYSPVQTFSIQPGIRIIYNSQFKAPVVYSINFKYNPSQPWAMRLSFAKGFRSPSLKELYFNYTQLDHLVYGNPNLNAEYSYNLNAALNYTIPAKGSTLGFGLTAFYNQIKNKIDYIQDPNNQLQAYLDNLPIDLYKNYGGTFILKYQFLQVLTSESTFGLTAVSKLEDETDFSHSWDFTENLLYKNAKYKFNFSINYKYYGQFTIYNAIRMNDGTMNIQSESLAGGYHNLDVQFTKHFLDGKLSTGVGAKNLFDNTRIELSTTTTAGKNSGLVGYGRTYFINLTYTIN